MKDSHAKELSLDLSVYRDWISKRDAAQEKDADKPTFFVTISREYGCQGYEIADLIVKKINERTKDNWSLFTHGMIEEMIATEEIDAEMAKEVSETRWSFKDWFIDALVPSYMKSQSTQVFEKVRNVILNLADKGNCVILGAGSQIITQRLDPAKFNGNHFRIVAGFEWRANRMAELYKIGRVESENLVREKQNLRDSFVTDFTSMDANDPSLYNLVFNDGRNDVELIAETCFKYLELSGAFE